MMERILVVEDSPTQAEAVKLILSAEGYAPEIAESAEQALERLAAGRPDLVVSDVNMPGLSGYELCQRIKSEDAWRDIPVVLLTSRKTPMDIIQGLECGADAFMTKPYEPDALVARIRNLLENQRVRSDGKAKLGLELVFLGRRFVINSQREQMLNLLITTFEDIVEANEQLEKSQAALAEAKASIEEFARDTELKYRRLFEAAQDAILIVDADSGKIQEVNSAAERLIGASEGTLRGLAFDAFDPEQGEGYLADLIRDSMKRPPSTPIERAIRSPDGRAIPVDVMAKTIDFGGWTAAMVVLRDLTERKAIESQLIQAQKMEAVGRLTGGVAHDFNNLLTVIMGNLQLLERTLDNDAKGHARVDKIMAAAKNGAELTRRLLTFSRQQVLTTTGVDVNGLVREMESMIRRTLGEHIVLVTALDSSLGAGRTDHNQLENALLNLCINARDAMPDGGQLTIETRPRRLDEAYAAAHEEVTPGDYIELSVTDTGTGIAPAIIGKVFDPFFTTKGPGKGTGLGLSTIFGFMKQTGGHVSVYSEVGHGTTLKLYVPHGDGGAAVLEEAATAPEMGDCDETILVVEDDEEVRSVAVAMLQDAGFEVIEAANGAEGLQAFADHPDIAAVFSDVVMPGGMTGPEMAERIRQQSPDIPILFASGYAEQALKDRAALLHACGFIAKPYDAAELPKRIQQLIMRGKP